MSIPFNTFLLFVLFLVLCLVIKIYFINSQQLLPTVSSFYSLFIYPFQSIHEELTQVAQDDTEHFQHFLILNIFYILKLVQAYEQFFVVLLKTNVIYYSLYVETIQQFFYETYTHLQNCWDIVPSLIQSRSSSFLFFG